MADNAVNKSITIDMDEETETKEVNSFGDAIKGMGDELFKRHPEKTSNISSENANGIIRVKILNEYMDRNFGFKYETLNKLVEQKQIHVVSIKGFGIEKFIEVVKSIQASFEQTQLPDGIRGILNRR